MDQDQEPALVNKPKTKSPVWAYFGFKPGPDGKPADPLSAICRLCKFPAAAKGGNTSNLFSHLEKKYPTEYAAIKSGIRASTEASSSRPSDNRQRTIVEAVAANQKYSRSSKRWQQLTNSVTHCLAKDMMPIYSIEKPGFKKMLQTFDSRYELPSRKYFTNTALPQLYSKVRETVVNELQSAKFYSSTTDMWSSEGLLPYISYTVHFVNSSWEYTSRNLETCFLPVDHTGENIADAIRSTHEAWNLPMEKLVCMTTDNGANIIKASEELKCERLPCFGHCLNLAVTNTLKDDARVCRALGVARKIVSSFSMSWKKRRDLTKLQLEKGLPQHSLIAVSD